MSDVPAVMDIIAHAFGERCPLCVQEDPGAIIIERHVHILEWIPKDDDDG